MSKSIVLRHLNGEGPVEILTRVMDFNIQQLSSADGKVVEIPANTLVAFTAQRFREVERDLDEWEFTTLRETKAGPTKEYIYLSGKDIFMVRAVSKVA